ncbi:MAG: hypothetical protein Q8N16_03490 [bacterium]|nr:hypothetical protein [bacterium]
MLPIHANAAGDSDQHTGAHGHAVLRCHSNTPATLKEKGDGKKEGEDKENILCFCPSPIMI